MHWAFVKTSLPFTASPVRPSPCVRKVSSSSYLYFETTGLSPVTFGSAAPSGTSGRTISTTSRVPSSSRRRRRRTACRRSSGAAVPPPSSGRPRPAGPPPAARRGRRPRPPASASPGFFFKRLDHLEQLDLVRGVEALNQIGEVLGRRMLQGRLGEGVVHGVAHLRAPRGRSVAFASRPDRLRQRGQQFRLPIRLVGAWPARWSSRASSRRTPAAPCGRRGRRRPAPP